MDEGYFSYDRGARSIFTEGPQDAPTWTSSANGVGSSFTPFSGVAMAGLSGNKRVEKHSDVYWEASSRT